MRTLRLVSIASDAAACCLTAGQPEKAIELLERGRSLAWSQALSLQTDVSDLERSYPEEATKFKELSARLTAWTRRGADIHGNHEGLTTGDRTDGSVAVAQGHQLAAKWNALVAQIRDLPGFNQFLMPAAFSTLTKAARNGSIVVFNSSQTRHDAIIIPPCGDVEIVPLPKVHLVELEKYAFDAARGRGRRVRGPTPELVHETKADVPTLAQALAWLWENIVSFLVEPLQRLNGSSERLWLCPTGLFTFLPIHAASVPESQGFIDLFTISYTPTITALLRVQGTSSVKHDGVRMLAVGQRHSTFEGFDVLTQTSAELQAIAKHVPSHDLLILEDDEATIDRVLSEITHRSWIHFCCHGHQDEDPLMSSLHMADGGLKMSDFTQLHIKHAQFAFLSACETATGSTSFLSWRRTSFEPVLCC